MEGKNPYNWSLYNESRRLLSVPRLRRFCAQKPQLQAHSWIFHVREGARNQQTRGGGWLGDTEMWGGSTLLGWGHTDWGHTQVQVTRDAQSTSVYQCPRNQGRGAAEKSWQPGLGQAEGVYKVRNVREEFEKDTQHRPACPGHWQE